MIWQVEKLFDIACTLTDVMACVPIEQYMFEYGPGDYLNQFLSMMSNLRGGRERYYPLLMAKINETLPASNPQVGRSITSAPSSRPGSGAGFTSMGNNHAGVVRNGSTGILEEHYENGSQARSSNSSSLSATPFGSPRHSASISRSGQSFDFDRLNVGLTNRNAVVPPTSTPFVPIVCGPASLAGMSTSVGSMMNGMHSQHYPHQTMGSPMSYTGYGSG